MLTLPIKKKWFDMILYAVSRNRKGRMGSRERERVFCFDGAGNIERK